MKEFWEFIKDRQAPFIMVIGVLLLIAGSFGVIPIGNPPYQTIDIIGRIAFWTLGSIVTILGVVLFIRETAKPKIESAVSMYPRHRDRETTNNLYENAFSSGDEVLYLSIMSQSTLKEIEPKLQQAQIHRTKLRVLTLDPDLSKETIESIRSHLNENSENPSETTRQIRRAWEQWTDIAKRYPNVEIRKYKSIPTLQIILVGDKYATIELLPYNTHPRERPGLVITRKANPELFQLIQEKYLRLWNDSVP